MVKDISYVMSRKNRISPFSLEDLTAAASKGRLLYGFRGLDRTQPVTMAFTLVLYIVVGKE